MKPETPSFKIADRIVRQTCPIRKGMGKPLRGIRDPYLMGFHQRGCEAFRRPAAHPPVQPSHAANGNPAAPPADLLALAWLVGRLDRRGSRSQRGKATGRDLRAPPARRLRRESRRGAWLSPATAAAFRLAAGRCA